MTMPDGNSVTVKGQLLCAIMDLPAKAALLNCNQYNGAFGCSTCKQEGSVVSSCNIAVWIHAFEHIIRYQLEEEIQGYIHTLVTC